MRATLATLLVALAAASSLTACKPRTAKPVAEEKKDYAKPLPQGEQGLIEVPASELPALRLTPSDRSELIRGIDRSLAFLAKGSKKYQVTADHGTTAERLKASLIELKRLLGQPSSDEELMAEIRSRFTAMMSVGCDGQGTVLMTGYYTPVFNASRTRSDRFRYPLHRRPKDLVDRGGDQPAARTDGSEFPDANQILETDVLKGQELVWLENSFEAYLVRVQGSARLRLPDGSQINVGFAGTTNHPYVGIGAELIKEGKIPAAELSMDRLRAYFANNPDELAGYIRRNRRYVFFTETKGGPFGCLGQEVEPDVTIATDKSIFPPGAPVIITHRTGSGNGPAPAQSYAGLRLDQDAGGGIRAPGRADLYMGVGDEAGRRAGAQYAEGRMYYLFLKQ